HSAHRTHTPPPLTPTGTPTAPGTPPLPLHDALPISRPRRPPRGQRPVGCSGGGPARAGHRRAVLDRRQRRRLRRRAARVRRGVRDRKSTRLNSSHVKISYAVSCWKKTKKATFSTNKL